MVLFLSSDIFTFQLRLNLSGLPLLRSTLHRANIGHGWLRTVRCFSLSCLCFSHTLFGSLGEGVLIIFLGRLRRFRLRESRLHIHAYSAFQQERVFILLGSKTRLPVFPFVQTGPSGCQNDLSSEGGFDKAGEDGAVSYLRRDDLIDRQQGTLAKIRLLRIRGGVGS